MSDEALGKTAGRVGLIAGNRTFPLHVARAARRLGIELVAIAFQEETSHDLDPLVPAIHWIHLGQVGKLLEILRQAQITQVILAGQVHPSHLTRQLAHLDGEGFKLLARAATRQGPDLLKLFTDFLGEHGIAAMDSSAFLKEWIPASAGALTTRAPTAQEQAAITYGVAKAQQLAAAHVGQTVVVKARAVVAVEAMEGTDAAIRRAGEVAGPGTVVVKMPEPHHDMRFDIPVVGTGTIEAMRAAQATALAVAAGKTLLMDRPELIAVADQWAIAIVAVSTPE